MFPASIIRLISYHIRILHVLTMRLRASRASKVGLNIITDTSPNGKLLRLRKYVTRKDVIANPRAPCFTLWSYIKSTRPLRPHHPKPEKVLY